MSFYEVADAAHITPRHLRKLISIGKGPVVTLLGDKQIVLEDDHNRWLRSWRQVSDKPKRGRPPKIEQNRDAAPAE
jgi:hypothetical protein